MHRGGGFSPSEKLNQLYECDQSEYERDEIALLLPALNPLFFEVALADVLEVLGPLEVLKICSKMRAGAGLARQFRISDLTPPMH